MKNDQLKIIRAIALFVAIFLFFPGFILGAQAQYEEPLSPSSPTVIISLQADADATLIESSAVTNFGTNSLLTVRRDDFGYLSMILVRFDLSPIPDDAIINNAEMQLNLAEATVDSSNVTLDVSRVTQSWSEGSVTWGSRPARTSPFYSRGVGTSIGIWYAFPVTDAVQKWFNQPGSYPNYGLAISGPSLAGHQRAFRSREAAEYRPRLVVRYTPMQYIYLPQIIEE